MNRILVFSVAVVMCCVTAMAGHVMVDGVLGDSRIYPGTVHTYQVYVPQQYDGRQAACLYVGLDGVLCNAPQVMDSLITAGKMPVTIGVFLQPGLIKDAEGNVVRYNRSNEFDMPDATFATFLESELLPQVEGMATGDGRTVRLSVNANDRMIFGLSSGGICAFNAAWHRPDMFSRVFSGVGTFVAMRGGNDIQTIVRKHEPKPLRIFLQDGTQDVWNALFGHWYEGNRMLATALDFAGYDAAYDWSDCKHGVSQASKIFAQVMEWMWRDYPEPVKAGKTQNDLLAQLLPEGQSEWSWMVLDAPSEHATAGDAVYPDSSFVVKRHEGSNCLWQYTIAPDGTLENGQRFYWLHSYDNSLLNVGGMEFDSQGNLYVITNAGLQILDQNGRVRGILSLPVTEPEIIEGTTLRIDEGMVSLVTPQGKLAQRKLNIQPAKQGVCPKSQGQG
ncbi:MAG: hypothetical protein KBT13_10080 [Bacteroidales bacterium]|nr:hypothetical protein [Candidatus Sodaliphilus limicaballi]